MFTTILLLVALALLAFIAWKLVAGTSRDALRQAQDDARLHREMLENMRRELQEARERDREHLQERLDGVSKMLTNGLTETSKTMQGQFRQSAAIIKEVTEKLTKLDETNKQVLSFSEQLKDFENILRNPKSRGLISEYWLETMLSHVLPPAQFKMQYSFPNGEVVDAVVFLRDKIIPIDAKFSSERFNRIVQEKDEKLRAQLEKAFRQDLKQRVDETAKYIRPQEGTTDFAFMFIPSEGIFYDLLVQKVGTVDVNKIDLIEYAFTKRVIIVSPVTFFAYLQTVLQGLKELKMEGSMQEILKKVTQLGKHLQSYESYMQKLGNQLGTTVNTYNTAYKEFQKVDRDVLKLSEGKVGGQVEVMELEKPISTPS